MSKYSFEDLKNKVCVLTGGGGVIGGVIAKGLASAGVRIAILDIKKEYADKVVDDVKKDFNVEIIGVEANVLDKTSLELAKKQILEKFAQIYMQYYLLLKIIIFEIYSFQ